LAEFWDKEELVGKLGKNSREEIQVKRVEKNGRKYIDIRVFWFDNNADEFKPSQKGVTVPCESFKEFKDILDLIIV
jgi:hypothetical protein